MLFQVVWDAINTADYGFIINCVSNKTKKETRPSVVFLEL